MSEESAAKASRILQFDGADDDDDGEDVNDAVKEEVKEEPIPIEIKAEHVKQEPRSSSGFDTSHLKVRGRLVKALKELFVCVFFKWTDKCYAMLDFESDLDNLEGKYLAIERHIFQNITSFFFFFLNGLIIQ